MVVCRKPDLLLFDPTRGIDVGTKHEIYVLMRAYAEAGGSILFHSTEIPELVHLCDRVIVLYGGHLVAEIGAADLSEPAIMRPALGAGAWRKERPHDPAGHVEVAGQPRHRPLFAFRIDRYRGLLTAVIVFVALLLVVDLIGAGPLSYFDISFLSSGGATLAISAIGETLVILSGGFDLSASAVLSLVNVVIATSMNPTDLEASVGLWTMVGVAIGMVTGAFNGFFIAFLRLQPIVVTLSTMFILQGVTLLVLEKPGGFSRRPSAVSISAM